MWRPVDIVVGQLPRAAGRPWVYRATVHTLDTERGDDGRSGPVEYRFPFGRMRTEDRGKTKAIELSVGPCFGPGGEDIGEEDGIWFEASTEASPFAEGGGRWFAPGSEGANGVGEWAN